MNHQRWNFRDVLFFSGMISKHSERGILGLTAPRRMKYAQAVSVTADTGIDLDARPHQCPAATDTLPSHPTRPVYLGPGIRTVPWRIHCTKPAR